MHHLFEAFLDIVTCVIPSTKKSTIIFLGIILLLTIGYFLTA
ncbi:putative membrane protein [Klebsiella phage Muenster]|nr:putative membrane protein [Klebsiella phage Muenster]